MKMAKHLAVAGGLVLACVAASAGEVSFSAKPSAAKDGDKAKISFTVSGPTDVEVAVLAADGKVVRHLAAGVLGGKLPPPEPLMAGLCQTVEWDGKDDLGKAAGGGPFRVRARAGMRVGLDGFLAESRNWIAAGSSAMTTLATDSKGNLYVFSPSVQPLFGHTYFLQVFNRKGEYQRTLLPMPANLTREKARPFGLIETPGDAVVPVNRFGTWPQFYTLGEKQFIATRVGDDGIASLFDGFSIGRIAPDGGSADPAFGRPVWQKRPDHYAALGPRIVTPSPDGKWLYLSGFRADAPFPEGRVYRMKAEPGGFMEKFVDLPAPAAPAKLDGEGTSYPWFSIGTGGTAFDPDGNLLVCDRLGGIVRAYGPDGKELGGVKVEKPQYVACHRKTGEVYVLTNKYTGYAAAQKSLIKFSGWKADAREVARLDFKPNGYTASMTLDDSAEPPVVWATGDLTGKFCLLRLEDRGGKFEQTADLMDLNKDRFGVKPRMAVHPETDLVICNNGGDVCGGYNGLTGAEVKLPFPFASDMGVGLDGNWYLQISGGGVGGYSGPICRFDRDLKPIPVAGAPAGNSSRLGDVYGRMGAGYCTVGLAADWKGRVYSMQMHAFGPYSVAVFGPDGKPEDSGRMKDDPDMQKNPRYKSAIIGPMDTRPGGIQLDYRGNIYVGLSAVPPDHRPPAGFEKDDAYRVCVGSVVKFKPEGGAIVGLKDKAAAPTGKAGLVMNAGSPGATTARFVENGLAVYPALGAMAGGIGHLCMCRQPMFQVDGFGRIFYPNAITNSVRAVDNAGNEILSFGSYGNIDSRGPGADSPIKKPDVPLGWPEAVGVSHKAIYVSDVLNRRIVRMKKAYAAEETCEVK